MAYPTAADLVAESQVEALTGLSPAEQAELHAAAIAAIEDYCNQEFTETVAARPLDGTGRDFLALDKRLAAFTGISIQGSSIQLSDVTLSEDRDKLIINRLAVLGNYYRQAIAEDDIAKFPYGLGNVTVTGTWGWLDAEFPPNVRAALRRDMEDQALGDKNTMDLNVRAFRSMGLASVSQPRGMGVQMNPGAGLSPRVQRLLNNYVWMPTLGGVA